MDFSTSSVKYAITSALEAAPGIRSVFSNIISLNTNGRTVFNSTGSIE